MLIIFFEWDFSDLSPLIKLQRYRRKGKLPGHFLKTVQFKESLIEEAESSAIVGLEDIWDENFSYQVFKTEEKRKLRWWYVCSVDACRKKKKKLIAKIRAI